MIAPRTIDEREESVGEDVGANPWRPVPRDEPNRSADVTGDHQGNRAVEPRSGGAGLIATLTFERPDGDGPVCVAESLIRLQA